MTIDTTTDRLAPVLSLSTEELLQARQVVLSDPSAVLPAIEAALGHGEATLDRMGALFEEVRRCAT